MASSRKDIEAAYKMLNSTTEKQEETEMALAPFLNSERLLSPAPMCIAFLGHTLLVTQHKDCSLEKEGVEYKHIKYPSSLRASVLHMTNKGWRAFQKAERSMDQIKIYSDHIPPRLKTAVQYIVKGSEREMELMLPDILEEVKTAADECVKCSLGTEDAFNKVIDLLDELLEACGLTEGEYEEKLKEAATNKEVLDTQKERAQKTEEELRKQKEYLEIKTKEAMKQYEEEVKSMPGIAKLFTASLAENLSGLFVFRPKVSRRYTTGRDKPDDNKKTASFMESLPSFLTLISGSFNEIISIIDAEVNGSTSEEADKEQRLTELSSLFEKTAIPIEDKKRLQEMKKVLQRGKELASGVKRAVKSMDANPQTLAKFRQEAVLLKQKIDTIRSVILSKDKAPLEQPLPRVVTEESHGITDAYVQGCYFKVEQAEKKHKQYKEDYEKTSLKLEKENEHMTKLLVDLTKVRLETIDFTEIKKVLKRTMGALHRVAMEWKKLAVFFGKMSGIINSSFEVNVKSLVSRAGKGGQLAQEKCLTDVTVNALYLQSVEVNKVSLLVSHLAAMYVEISENHLLEPMSNLGELLDLSTSEDQHKIEQKQVELTKNAETASKAIRKIVRKNRTEYETKVRAREERFNKKLKCLLPAKPREAPEVTAVREDTVKWVEEMKQSEADSDDMDYLLL